MTARRRPRPGALVTAALVTSLALTGCGGDRTPSAPDDPGSHPAVTPRQALQILGDVDAALVRATTARDARQLGDRAVGPAQLAIAASIRVQAALKQTPTAPAAPTKPRLLLTAAGPWPRWFAAAGATPASPTPVLRIVQSADARHPYGLWGQLNLLPGATLPDVAPATAAVTPLGQNASGLLASPGDVLARYTDLLNRGDASAFAAQFAADAYRSELTQQLAADRRTFASGVGQVLDKHTQAGGSPFALPTTDGGALVIGCVNQTYSISVTSGRRQVRLDPALAGLAGRSVVSSRLQRLSVELFAFYVPKAGSSEKIGLIAAGHADVSAAGA